MKLRVIETIEDNFYPQFKPGFFRSWRFFHKDSEENIDRGWMFQRSLETYDPRDATCFNTEREAQEFLKRISEKVERYWAEESAKRVREIHGVNVKKSHKADRG